MNIMITNVSTIYLPKISSSQYELNDEPDLKTDGVITNEAPIKLLMQKLARKNEKLDQIIFIVSNKAAREIKMPDENVLNEMELSSKQIELMKEVAGETAVGYLQKKIKDAALKYGCEVPKMEEVSILDEPDDREVVKCIMNVQNKLIENAENELKNVYIEANGGIRYVMFMLSSIMNVLQSQYNNIKLESVFSTIYKGAGSEINIVRDTKSTYISAQLVAAVNEFTNYGRIFSLKNYFNIRRKMDVNKDSGIMWKDIFACINKLSEISEALQLCRSARILELFYGRKDGSELGIKNILDDFKSKYRDSNFADAEIFIYVIDIINKQYEYLYADFETNIGAINNLPRLIKWCIEKDYIQQAITIYIEKMPDYYFNNKYIGKELVDLEKVEIGPADSSKTSKGFYTDLYDYCAGNMKKETLCDKVQQKVLGIWDKVCFEKRKENAFIRELTNVLNKKIDAAMRQPLEEVKRIAILYINNEPRVIKLKDGGECCIQAGKLEKFMNSLRNGNNKDELYAIVYKCKNNEQKQSSTYEKKLMAIENLDKGKVKVKDAERLVHIMKYYLAVKLIRNRVNHASEKDISEDENKAIKKMKDYGITIDMNFENIKNILLQGIQEA